MKQCSHELGIFSTMETVGIDSYNYYRKCKVCGFKEVLPRAGKLYVGVSVEAESKRDFERRDFAKDLIQAYDARGNVNPEFQEAWGKPEERAKPRKGKPMENQAIKNARQKMKDRAGKV